MLEGQLPALVSFAAMLAAGQLLFKRAALRAPNLATTAGMVGLAKLPSFWLALILYGAATLLWLRILHVLPLSRAYPFAALGFILVPAGGALLFKEKLTRSYFVGMLLILMGLLAISTT